MEMWTGETPHLNHIHVFSCTEHILVPSKQHDKLDDCLHLAVYLSPAQNCTGHHHLLYPDTGCITETHDVIFEEDQACLNMFDLTVLDDHYKSDSNTEEDDFVNVNISSSGNKNINISPTSSSTRRQVQGSTHPHTFLPVK